MTNFARCLRLLAEAAALAGFLFFVIQTLAVIAPERIT